MTAKGVQRLRIDSRRNMGRRALWKMARNMYVAIAALRVAIGEIQEAIGFIFKFYIKIRK